MGLTDQTDAVIGEGNTYVSWLKQKTAYKTADTLIQHVAKIIDAGENDKVMSMLKWLGIFEETPLPAGKHSSAEILLGILLTKWSMAPEDKDMVAMQHEIEIPAQGKENKADQLYGAERGEQGTVGNGKDSRATDKYTGKNGAEQKIVAPTGVVMPNMASVYRPVLTETGTLWYSIS